MSSISTSKAVAIGLGLNAVLLGAVLVVLLGRNDAPSLLPAAYGQQVPQPIAGGAGLFLMPAQLSPSTWGCYVMDVDRQTLMVYYYAPTDRKLRLMAARDFTFDRQLRQFNTDEPTPPEVRSLIEKEQDTTRVRP